MRERCVCSILTILMVFLLVVGCAAMPSAGAISGSEVIVANLDNTSSTEVNKNPELAFPYYQPIMIAVNHSVPPYQLPLNLSIITNIENITGKIRLNDRKKIF